MNLFPDEIRMRFESVGNQSHKADPVVLCKFFNPTGAGTWYATEFDPRTNIFYGFVSIFGDWNDEWGCFSLQELRDFRGAFGLGIERDIFFEPKPFSHIGIGKGQIDTEMLV